MGSPLHPNLHIEVNSRSSSVHVFFVKWFGLECLLPQKHKNAFCALWICLVLQSVNHLWSFWICFFRKSPTIKCLLDVIWCENPWDQRFSTCTKKFWFNISCVGFPFLLWSIQLLHLSLINIALINSTMAAGCHGQATETM